MRENMERYITLISPEPVNLTGMTEADLRAAYNAAVDGFSALAKTISEEAYEEAHMDYQDILEDMIYLMMEDNDLNLSELAYDVIFVANNVEHDNANWAALQAGVPFDDVLA